MGGGRCPRRPCTLTRSLCAGRFTIGCADRVQDGTLRKTQRPFHFFPTAPPIDEDEGVGSDNNPVEDDDDDDEEDSMTVQSTKSPPATTSATSANAKKHGMDEGVNGVTKKRRKNASNGKIDADVLMADAVPSPPLTEELITTNGRSVGTQIEDVVEITEADTLIVEEDDKGIVSCAWNPVLPTLLATASAKSIARIWNVPEDAVTSGDLEQFDLPHEPSRMSTEKAHVTAIRWSPDGIRLASGSYDGQTRIWTAEGKLEHNMWLHDGPVSSLKWNKSTSILLALSCDGKMVAWDVATGDTHRVFDLGKDTVIGEVEWISNSQFMACGENGSIYQFDIGVEEPLHSRTMHSGEVSCIAWDDLSSTIATGGQDAVIRVHPDYHPSLEICVLTRQIRSGINHTRRQPQPGNFVVTRRQ